MALVGVNDVDGIIFSFLSYIDLKNLSQCTCALYQFLLREDFWRDWCLNCHKLARYKMSQITWREYGTLWYIRNADWNAHLDQIILTESYHIMDILLKVKVVSSYTLERGSRNLKNLNVLDWLYDHGHIAKNYHVDQIERAIIQDNLEYIKTHFSLIDGIASEHIFALLEYQSYRIFDWLIEQKIKLAVPLDTFNYRSCDKACEMGRVNIVQWFCEQNIFPTDNGIFDIIEHDHVELYEFLSTLPTYSLDVNEVVSLIGMRCPESIIKWMYMEAHSIELSASLLNTTLILGETKLAVWMLDRGCESDDETIVLIGIVGNYDMFKSLIDYNNVVEHGCDYTDVANNAAFNGHVTFIDKLKEEFGIIPDRISIDFHLDSLKWMEVNTDLQATFDSDPTYSVDKIRWVMERNVIPSQDWINNSFVYDCYDVTAYLLEQGYRPNIDNRPYVWDNISIRKLLLLMSYDINPGKEDVKELKVKCPELEQWSLLK
jgi:hypothetical protein